VAALGVVFGDIGTSPLYTLRACLGSARGLGFDAEDVLGVLSLIFWTLTLVVSVKYVTVIMRADNRGEGGIFSLLALIRVRAVDARRAAVGVTALLVIAGAALLYGDGMITPAISVLSAVEGLEVAAPWLRPAVIPLTCAVLAALFAVQRGGTGRLGRVFGPVMLLWFVTLAALGARHIAGHPAVLGALGPQHALRFFATHGLRSLVVLGSVVLAVTGAEALYADMGHFGAAPIRAGWFALVMPALVLNYLGQGALILADPAAARNPFFALVPNGAATYALVGLSTVATVIASQALISGAFSLTYQAIQLDFLPPMQVIHTSRETEGQIYLPAVNRLLAIASIALVLGFRNSSRLAAAYGIAVTGTMLLTSIIFFEVARTSWRWPLWKAALLLGLFLAVDIPFFAANLLKFIDGGFLPIALGAVLFLAMATWRAGRRNYRAQVEAASPPLPRFLADCREAGLARPAARVAVFLTGHPDIVPPALRTLVERVRALPETVVLMSMRVEHVPRVPMEAGGHYDELGDGFHRLVVERGYLDHPDVPAALARACQTWSIPLEIERATFYTGRASFVASAAGHMGRWSESLFAFMSRNARPVTEDFRIPPAQVVEINARLDL
jgi:KUP system potassium uptake protein